MDDAVVKLKEHFGMVLAAPVDLDGYMGDAWWQLTPAQAEVFGLELDDMPALVGAWVLYESIADVASHAFARSALCVELRVALPSIERGVIDPAQWREFASLLGIREKKAFAWFYKAAFEIEQSWAAPIREDDDTPMPRAAFLRSPTHHRRIMGLDFDDLIPF